MFWFIYVTCIVATQATVLEKPHLHAFTDELIRYVNEESGASWKAAPSKRFNNLQQAKSLLGAWFETEEQRQSRRPTMRYMEPNNDLPKSFDARTQWPDCPSISEIRDQSSCGSCWAFGAVEAMTDRRCIHSKGELKDDLSARDLLSCCSYCGDGCHGGFPPRAWDFWKNEGIVTGGSLENPNGCQPYPFPKCNHHSETTKVPPCPDAIYPTPKCEMRCQIGSNQTYFIDKSFGKSSYNLPLDSAQIMREIMTNGPVEGSFVVYEDFLNYHSGIYQHVAGKYLGGHAIRILGWGEENNVPYWLCANSWNENWGENGYFRILRGRDECLIEAMVTAGLPRL